MYTIKGVKMFGNEESCEFTADSTFHWESQESTSGGDNAESRIKELFEAGKYVIVRAGPPIASGSTHFSPIVGWDESKNQPKIMDVAGG